MKPSGINFAIKITIPLVVFVHLLVSSVAQQSTMPLSLENANQSNLFFLKSDKAPTYVQPITNDRSIIRKPGNSVQKFNLPILYPLLSNNTTPLRYGIDLPPKDRQLPVIKDPISSLTITGFPAASEYLQNLELINLTGPVGTPDHYIVPNDTILSIPAPGFLGNDIDLDGETLTATAILASPQNGEVSAFADGSFTYTPDAEFVGKDSFAYRMQDASFNLSDTIWVTTDVLPPANRNPVGSDDTYAAISGTILSIPSPGLLGNDIDPDGETLTATAILASPQNGEVSAFADGNFTYMPDAEFIGIDSFAYRMRDESFNLSDTIWVTLNVVEGNRAPIGVDDEYAAVLNTPLTIAAPGFLDNDIDLDGETLSAAAILVAPENGEVSAFADGSFTYTPDAEFVGKDSFAYRMRDASFHLSDTVTITIEVSPGGTTPVGTPDQYAIPNDQTLTIAAPGILANDIDLDGETLTATAILASPQNGEVSAFADGSFTYTPDAEFVGKDSFAYRMQDASSNFSDTIWVTTDVLPPANRNPVGSDDTYAAISGTILSIPSPGLLGNDIDPDGETLTATAILTSPQNGEVSAFADGNFTYTPDAEFIGKDSFAYRMWDESFNLSDTIWVTLNVVEGNRAPIGVDDEYAAVLNTPLTIAAPGFLDNDIDLDGETLSATAILVAPENGEVSAFADGSFTYTPDAGYVGIDSFGYRMRDESFNLSDTIWVSINIINTNLPPVADAGEDLTVECSGADSIMIVLDGSGSTDPEDDPLTYTWREKGETIAGPTMDAQYEVMLANRPYTIVLTVEDGMGSNSDTSSMKLNILDTLPPVVSAAFESVFDYGVIRLYKLKCSVYDLCDDELTTTSVIALPDLINPQITFKHRVLKRVKVFPKDNIVIVESPDPEAFWAQIQSSGGISVKDNQPLTMLSGPKDLYCYNFNFRGNLKSIIGPEALLQCMATDASGNTALAEATSPEDNFQLKNVVTKSKASQKIEIQREELMTLERGNDLDAYKLEQNFPNPFSRTTSIRFALSDPGLVQVNIFDHMGHRVTMLVNTQLSSGSHEVVWKADGLPAGVYYYQIRAGDFSQIRKMVLLR